MSYKVAFTGFLLFLLPFSLFSQDAFQDGEWFKFRIHYGVFNASFATLEVSEKNFNNKDVFHIVGQGKSTGLLHWFFKVDDNYESYIDIESNLPYRFIRQIDEGGHTRDVQIDYNQAQNKAFVFDRKHDQRNTYTTGENVHDMLSAFYYIRNDLNGKELQEGEEYTMNMFFDDETHVFKFKFLGKEMVKTKFGKVATLKFRPYVMAGRVFKEKESLTFWLSDDRNKIPVKIKADLAVGSLDADLEEFKGLKYPFVIEMK